MFEIRRQGAVQVLTGDEAITANTIGQVEPLLANCFAQGQPKIVIDLERVPLLDSAGLEWLVDASEKCLQRGGQAQLAAPTLLCADILRATGVSEQIELFDDVTGAVRSFSR